MQLQLEWKQNKLYKVSNGKARGEETKTSIN